jgi:hypothetical protein
MSKVNKELYYADQMRHLWLKYGHEPDVPEIDFSWRSWKTEGERQGR